MSWWNNPVIIAARRAGLALIGAVWPFARMVVRRLFEILFALVLLFEEWGWRPLADLLARLARFPLVARLESIIADLPPYGALAVFILPSIFLVPLKLLALYLIATGHALMAGLLFVGAKIGGTAVLARLFMLTKPKLMQIGWFARVHDWLMPWKDRMFAAIRASWAWRYGRIVKYRVGQAVKARWAEFRPRLMEVRQRVMVQARETIARVREWWR